MIIMIIAELSGRCRQSPIVLGGEGQSLGTKDTLSIGPLDTHWSHVFINPDIYSYIYFTNISEGTAFLLQGLTMTFLTRDIQVSRVRIRRTFVHHFEFFLKTAHLEARLPTTLILRPWSAPRGEDFAPFLLEIHKLSTKTLWNIEERPI